MRLVKTPDFILNLDKVYAIECIPVKTENHPGRTHQVIVNGSNTICYLNGGDSEKNRFLNAIYNAGKYDACVELDEHCYQVREEKESEIEQSGNWLKAFELV